MTKTRREFAPEFKREAVALLESSGRPLMQVKALEERGLYLAKGDRRGFVAVTYEGEVLSVARYSDRKAKDIAAKLGFPEGLRSVDQTLTYIAGIVVPRLQRLRDDADAAKAKVMASLDRERLAMKMQHQQERARMESGLAARRAQEERARGARFRHGVKGIFDRLTGVRARIRKQNEFEAYMALLRDREQRQALIVAQLTERRELQRRIIDLRTRYAERMMEFHRDIARQMGGLDQSRSIQHSPQFKPSRPSFNL